MSRIDKRQKLEESPFDYKVTKDDSVLIYFHGRQVKLVKGKEAEKLLKRIGEAEEEKEVQLQLAKITGNFKRGNERQGKEK